MCTIRYGLKPFFVVLPGFCWFWSEQASERAFVAVRTKQHFAGNNLLMPRDRVSKLKQKFSNDITEFVLKKIISLFKSFAIMVLHFLESERHIPPDTCTHVHTNCIRRSTKPMLITQIYGGYAYTDTNTQTHIQWGALSRIRISIQGDSSTLSVPINFDSAFDADRLKS